MGHSSVTVTLDRYGHLYDGLDSRIAASTAFLRRSRQDSHGPAAAWD